MKRLNLRSSSLLLAAMAWGFLSIGKEPNIVLIVSDDQGYRDLGCFGSDEIKTPHLDHLAKGGVKLTNFYVAWPACTPSRGALLSGRYPQHNGIYDMIRNEAPDYGYKYKPGRSKIKSISLPRPIASTTIGCRRGSGIGQVTFMPERRPRTRWLYTKSICPSRISGGPTSATSGADCVMSGLPLNCPSNQATSFQDTIARR